VFLPSHYPLRGHLAEYLAEYSLSIHAYAYVPRGAMPMCGVRDAYVDTYPCLCVDDHPPPNKKAAPPKKAYPPHPQPLPLNASSAQA